MTVFWQMVVKWLVPTKSILWPFSDRSKKEKLSWVHTKVLYGLVVARSLDGVLLASSGGRELYSNGKLSYHVVSTSGSKVPTVKYSLDIVTEAFPRGRGAGWLRAEYIESGWGSRSGSATSCCVSLATCLTSLGLSGHIWHWMTTTAPVSQVCAES